MSDDSIEVLHASVVLALAIIVCSSYRANPIPDEVSSFLQCCARSCSIHALGALHRLPSLLWTFTCDGSCFRARCFAASTASAFVANSSRVLSVPSCVIKHFSPLAFGSDMIDGAIARHDGSPYV